MRSALTAYDLLPPVELFTLDSVGINNTTVGVRTGAGELILKTYDTQDDPGSIRYEHRLCSWLAARGLSFGVPVPIPTHSGETLSRTPEGWQALFVRLPGSQPDSWNLQHIEAVGAALGELHAALADFPAQLRPGCCPFGDLARIHARLPDPFNLAPAHLGLPDAEPYRGWLAWWRDELGALCSFVEGAYQRLPWQVIHSDFTPANTLVRDEQVTAILDFEFAQPDARALDLASGLRFTMLLDEQADPWGRAEALCRGYARWIRLDEAEIEALPWLIRLRDAASAIWWLGRGLASGELGPGLQRVERARGISQWLQEYGDRLVQENRWEYPL